MNPFDAFLAVDTSAYTTSVAVVSEEGIVADSREVLFVPKGSRGLRQSDAVFEHVRKLRVIFEQLKTDGYKIKAVAFSEKPCPTQGSYMPVFCVGASHAAAYASALGVCAYALTHQHGHIYAAFFGHDIKDGEYAAFHVSGGTLDILRVRIYAGLITDIEPIGGTLDLTCGQLIDRVGVAAGLSFPAGAHMEKLYQNGSKKLAVHVKGLSANLSGAETQAMRRLEQGEDSALVCSSVIDCVSETLVRLIRNTYQISGIRSFLFTGGVICNTIIRENIQKECVQRSLDFVFAQRALCSDNACGLALAAARLHKKGE